MRVESIQNKKVAIVHYWLDSYRGGEKVLEALCEMYPNADIYTHIYKPEKLPETLTKHNVKTTFISKLPFANKYYRHYLLLMPFALFLLNLKKYDLIISSESGPAKGIRKRKDALHFCYCHSPMRYIWDMEKEYVAGRKKIFRLIWKYMACYMRYWDRLSAKKVDFFIANSHFVAARIRKFYGRYAIVINPPIDIDRFSSGTKRSDFYLCVSEMVSYKKVDIVVKAFNKLKLPLVVVGGGNDFEKIKTIANGNIQVLGKVSDKVLKDRFERCKAFVYAGKEDFGIIFLEAILAGAPVIAYSKGGVRDIVINGKNGLLFKEQTPESVIAAIKIFESGDIKTLPANRISELALMFSKDKFCNKIMNYIYEKISGKNCL